LRVENRESRDERRRTGIKQPASRIQKRASGNPETRLLEPAIDKPNRAFLIFWLPVIAYCLAIFIQSSFPASSKIPTWPGSDKVLHALGYALLGALFYRAFNRQYPRKNAVRLILFSALSTGLYGLSDEIHQSFVPSRSADGFDVMADFLGGVAGVLAYHYLVTRAAARFSSNSQFDKFAEFL
jgi:hypothetical protein